MSHLCVLQRRCTRIVSHIFLDPFHTPLIRCSNTCVPAAASPLLFCLGPFHTLPRLRVSHHMCVCVLVSLPLLCCRMADGPLKLNKGPVALGLRVQDTFRLGAFRVEAVASRATAQVATAGAPPEVGWGGRAHVAYDHLPVGAQSLPCH